MPGRRRRPAGCNRGSRRRRNVVRKEWSTPFESEGEREDRQVRVRPRTLVQPVPRRAGCEGRSTDDGIAPVLSPRVMSAKEIAGGPALQYRRLRKGHCASVPGMSRVHPIPGNLWKKRRSDVDPAVTSAGGTTPRTPGTRRASRRGGAADVGKHPRRAAWLKSLRKFAAMEPEQREVRPVVGNRKWETGRIAS